MHAMIYFGFLILLGVTTVLEVNHQLPTDLKFLHGNVYRAYAFIGDTAGLIFTIGIVWAIVLQHTFALQHLSRNWPSLGSSYDSSATIIIVFAKQALRAKSSTC